MATLLQSIPLGLLPVVLMLAVLLALGVAVVRWWSIRRGSEPEPPADRPEESHGYPLASWRYVYDLDKSDAKREVSSVHEQAEMLADAEKKRRRK
ncbi:hypothetical protein C440_05540 [Haloferax mucosum ATCC BAA-1512]|uniref:Uncharacterized protein n=1 Tax=Haloferax mucosum ATCC BAA-1512 TaxID=662479 RepID=M0IJB1_9EURY|nr:hypothetical protein [Haloferax mucosum]ELZ96122.1 hypothetical protein C440_05540 [Haloferax mucosum ATCC BAA-1512]